MADKLRAPFPWFGGKSRAADVVWRALGDVTNYVEPFGGSGAVLLARPGGPGKVETYNDADGALVNAYRAIAADPDAVARAADWPVSEVDLHARHMVLVERVNGLTARLEMDPGYFDAELAGWWIWGACCWIGSGWCSGKGPWKRDAEGLITLGNAGQGIHRKLPHLGNAGQGIHQWFAAIAERLRRVRITCGDWRRVTTPSVVERHGASGVLLDPPYPEGWDVDGAYSGQTETADTTWEQACDAAIDLHERGNLVVLCGYTGLWDPPVGWTARGWTARKGYAADGGARQRREVLWCSPNCVDQQQPSLFGGGEA